MLVAVTLSVRGDRTRTRTRGEDARGRKGGMSRGVVYEKRRDKGVLPLSLLRLGSGEEASLSGGRVIHGWQYLVLW